MIVGDAPAAFLGKYVRLGNAFYEMLSHESGTVLVLNSGDKLIAYEWSALWSYTYKEGAARAARHPCRRSKENVPPVSTRVVKR